MEKKKKKKKKKKTFNFLNPTNPGEKKNIKTNQHISFMLKKKKTQNSF